MASWMKHKKQNEGWTIKNVRPDEVIGDPLIYYTDEEVEKYSRSTPMRRAQERIAYRIIELLKISPKSNILDLGCGPGYTSDVYRNENFKVTCLDVTPKMIEKAKEKGFKAFVGDMREIQKIFPNKKFDAVVSASALQWLKKEEDIKKVAEGIYSVLEKDSPIVIQFYPKNEQELKQTAKVFINNGFDGEIIMDWPDVPKNRTFYLVMKRK
jgi:cyclopropane fatty-acyl-phospholipid synthase-like methyltransferase